MKATSVENTGAAGTLAPEGSELKGDVTLGPDTSGSTAVVADVIANGPDVSNDPPTQETNFVTADVAKVPDGSTVAGSDSKQIIDPRTDDVAKCHDGTGSDSRGGIDSR